MIGAASRLQQPLWRAIIALHNATTTPTYCSLTRRRRSGALLFASTSSSSSRRSTNGPLLGAATACRGGPRESDSQPVTRRLPGHRRHENHAARGRQDADDRRVVDDLEGRTRDLLRHTAASSLPDSSNAGALLLEWNARLPHLRCHPARLLDMVELVDQLVRRHRDLLLRLLPGRSTQEEGGSSPSHLPPRPSLASSSCDELAAATVGMAAWALASAHDPHAAHRAEQLFQLVPEPRSIPADLQPNFVKSRRDAYLALLRVWSRCTPPSSSSSAGRGDDQALVAPADRCHHWLERMKQEEQAYCSCRHRLVGAPAFNCVIMAYARAGRVDAVEQLVKELRAHHRGGRPNAVTYDGWVRAYQAYNDRLGRDRAASQEAVGKAQDIFQSQLDEYRGMRREKGRHRDRLSLKPLSLTLGRILSILNCHGEADGPDRARATLNCAIEFERDYPECTGLVDLRAFLRVMQAHTRHGRVEEAQEVLAQLLQLHRETSQSHLRPSPAVFLVVLAGYAKRRDSDSLACIEAIVRQMEDHFVTGRAADCADHVPDHRLDCAMYNILITTYVRVSPSDAVSKIRATLAHMEHLALQHRNPRLRPDSVSYNILMTALVKQREQGYLKEVCRLLKWMQTAPWESARPDFPSYTIAFDALAKSSDPTALIKTQEILRSMDAPNTKCYSAVLHAYAKRGLSDEALLLLDQMKSDSRSGRNSRCRPDNVSYSSVLHALGTRLSQDGGSAALGHQLWSQALECLDDMLEDYRQGDEKCRPSDETIATLLRVLRLNNGTRDKHVAAGEVLGRLRRLDLHLGTTSALHFIQCCGETTGSAESRSESLSFVLDILKNLGSEANSKIFRAVLEACHKLIESGDEKRQIITKVFHRCAASGHVNWMVLDALLLVCPPDLYSLLTSQHAKNTPSF